MRINRGIVLLAVLWFLVLASVVLMTTERAASEQSALLWQLRQAPQQEADMQSLRLFLPALLNGETLPAGAPRWALRHAAAFARAGKIGRGSVTITMGSTPVTLMIRDTAGFLAPGWQPQILPALARRVAGPHRDYQEILQRLRARYHARTETGSLPAPVAWRLAALTTRHPVYGGRLNVNSVPAPVLQVLGISAARTRSFLRTRMLRGQLYTSHDLGSVMAVLGFRDSGLFGTKKSGVYRLTINGGTLSDGGPQRFIIHAGIAGASAVPLERPTIESSGTP